MVNVNLLVDGDKIVVTNAEKYHTVKPGDDIYAIAVAYGVSVKDIMALNPFMKEDDALLVDTRVRYH
jgi:LysM repeat protein